MMRTGRRMGRQLQCETKSTSQEIDARFEALVQATAGELDANRPASSEAGDRIRRVQQIQGIRLQLKYISDALLWCSPELFVDAVDWSMIALRRYGIVESDVELVQKSLARVFRESLSPEHASRACQIVESGLRRVTQPPHVPDSYLADDAPLASLARAYLDTLLAHDRSGAVDLIMKAAASGTPVRDLYLHVFRPVQLEIGRLWQLNRLDAAQEHYCTAATLLIASMIHIYAPRVPPAHRTLVAVAASSERHEFGIRMVADFFELAGWDIAFLGADTPLEGLPLFLEQVQADVLAISATMTTNLRAVAAIIDGVRSADLQKPPRIIVGGHPFDLVPDLWARVGADATASGPDEAIAVANRLLS